MAGRPHRVLPGFHLSLTLTLVYLTLLVFIPLAACFLRVSAMSWEQFVRAVWTERTRAAYLLSFSTSALSALANVGIGGLLAWVLVRYEFPGRRVFDSLVDLPLALPTAVAGLVYSSLYVSHGWLGRFLVPLGIHGAYSRFAIVLVLTFIGLPFVVRAVEPVLQALEPEMEEAAASLGASRWQAFRHVLFPAILPAVVTGFAMAFARGLGEYGSVIFVAGTLETEIAPMLVVARLEEFAYAEATAIAVVLLGFSFLCLIGIHWLSRWSLAEHE